MYVLKSTSYCTCTSRYYEVILSVISFNPKQSYVFQDRLPTPPECLKQNAYCTQLDDQVKHRRKQVKDTQDLEETLEREEQKELAEE